MPRPPTAKASPSSKAATAATAYAGTEKRSKPSVTKRAAGGAVTGATTGATIGSVVPGVGTAAGAVAGGVVGGVAGGASASKEKRAARSFSSRVLVAEFLLCTLVLALSPLGVPADKPVSPADWMKRGTALCGVFALLGMVSAVGPRAARASTALGGLVTLALVIDQRSVFGTLARKFATTSAGTGRQPVEGPPSVDVDEDGTSDRYNEQPRRYR